MVSSSQKRLGRLNRGTLATLDSDYRDETNSRVAQTLTGYQKSRASQASSIKLTLNSVTSEKRREGKLMLLVEMLRSCSVSPQQINLLRYEIMRTSRSTVVTQKLFREVFRAINIRMPMFEQKVFLEFFLTDRIKTSSKKQMVDAGRLKTLVDYFCRCHAELFANSKKSDPTERAKQRLSVAKTPMTGMEQLLEKLVKKIRVNFTDSSEAFRFFDLSANSRMRKEHFVFNCAFLEVDADYNDVSDLFGALDAQNRGTVDDEEFK